MHIFTDFNLNDPVNQTRDFKYHHDVTTGYLYNVVKCQGGPPG